jgi:hypothetical protein
MFRDDLRVAFTDMATPNHGEFYGIHTGQRYTAKKMCDAYNSISYQFRGFRISGF